jgi:hypothetical protein
MRREQESWRKEECIQEEKKSRLLKRPAKYSRPYSPYHCCSCLFFMHRPYIFRSGHTPSDLAIQCIAGVCFSVEREKE